MSFKVYNPSRGRWFVLHWWTDHDRGHLTFAKTAEALHAAARAVFEKEPYADCKGLYEIEMVAPSPKMEQLAVLNDRREMVDQFYNELCGRMNELLEARKKLPLPFVLCETYEPDEDTDTTDDWIRTRHYSCKNCDTRLKLVGFTREELYVKYAERWYALNPPYKHRPSRGQPVRSQSLAEPATDDEKIWFAYGNFGPHAGGIELHEVDLSEAEQYRPRWLSEQALFFYRLVCKLNDDGAREIRRTISETKAAEKRRKREVESLRKREREQHERNRIQVTLDFFKLQESHEDRT